MNQRTKALLFFMLLPTWAFAHGEEVLTTVFLFVGSLLLFFVLVLLIPLPYEEKAVLVAVYLTTIGLAVYFTSGLPYRINMTLINMVIGLTPVFTTVSAYLLLWSKRRKQNSK